MSGEDNQNDRIAVHPDHAGIIGDEGLAVSSFVSDTDVSQVARKPVVDLLFLHYAQDQIAGLFGDQFARRHHLEETADFARGAMTEIDAGIVDGVSKGLLHLVAT